MMEKILLSVLILFSIFSNSYGQKKTAALAPMGSLGELNELEKRVIFNSLQESLSKYYVLASQKMYEKAEEEAFQEMDADECTESQCIAIIQELLQTEFFFMFEIVKTGSFQQMKITRVDLDGNRDVRTETCDNCSISQVNGKVDGLVNKLTVSEEKFISTPIVETEEEQKRQGKEDKKFSLIISVGTPFSTAMWDAGGLHIPKKNNSSFSFGGKFGDHFLLYKSFQIEFDLKDNELGVDREINYITENQFLSYSYKMNTFTFGYNHLLNGKLTEDIKKVRKTSNYTYENNFTTDVEGYGISIGYIYDINEFFIWTLFDRYQLKKTSGRLNYDPGYFIFQDLSIGGGMQF